MNKRVSHLAVTRLKRNVLSEQTQKNIQEEEVVDLDEEMSIVFSVNWTGTCDVVAAFQIPPIYTTVQQQQHH